MDTKEFIKKAQEVHGDKYDYSKVKYVNPKTLVTIICPIHGEFNQYPYNHLQGKGCKKCGRDVIRKNMTKSLSDFISQANVKHNNKYDYSKVEYVDGETKVCIICPIHGEFWQRPSNHLNGNGCPSCKREHLSKICFKGGEQFIKEAKQIHEDKYDYSKVEYVNTHTKVCIICPIHGEFWQTPNNHLQGKGCPNCHGKSAYSTDKWVEKVQQIHDGKYDYSKVEYVNNTTKVCITCPTHGDFWQTPAVHIRGGGCPKCARNVKKTHEQFIEESKKIHGDKYDYTETVYTSLKEKVVIKCNTCGNIFKQNPWDHLCGKGCPHCVMSKLEMLIEDTLKKENIIYEKQKRFQWLGRQSLDFYLPEYNTAIECQGKQHFIEVDYFDSKIGFDYRQKQDKKKLLLCQMYNIQLLYFSKDKFETFLGEPIYHQPLELINKAKENGEKRLL